MARAIFVDYTKSMTKNTNILVLDMESGFGGSSKSLFLSIKYLKKISNEFNIEVWVFNIKGIIKEYPSIGVKVKKIENIPRSTSGETLKANVLELARAAFIYYKSRGCIKNIAKEINERFDLVHFNLESGYLFSYILRRYSDIPFVMHMRTIRPINAFSRLQVKIISKTINRLIFISESELERFKALKGDASQDTIVYNISERYRVPPKKHKLIQDESRLVVGSIANFSWDRGVDLLVDIANDIAKIGGKDKILFVHSGHLDVPKSFPGELGNIVRSGGSFSDYIATKKLNKMFILLGYVENPEEVIQSCDLIIKLFRNGSPYGRDVIEAYGLGTPVFSTGTSEVFVKHGKTGVLFPEFNSYQIAKEILKFSDGVDLKKMGDAGRLNVENICNPIDRANDLVNIWKGELVNEN